MKPGDKVHYLPKMENGIIKEMHPDGNKAWVVYHCAGEWDHYYKYTGALTYLAHLKLGWIKPVEPETKFSYN